MTTQEYMGQCDICARPLMREAGSFTTGYGVDLEMGHKVCYICCAEIDKASMRSTGRAVLYLTGGPTSHEPNRAWRISNWPGSLEFHPYGVRKSRAACFGWRIDRIDFWFIFEGWEWHGIVKGDMELARCKRTKRMSPFRKGK